MTGRAGMLVWQVVGWCCVVAWRLPTQACTPKHALAGAHDWHIAHAENSNFLESGF